jgi:DNA-directed RNA polymerase subunit alpha
MLDKNLIQVKVIEATDTHGVYDIEPLERGYAQTLGNPLRRILLSSLAGAAVTGVKITGVKHEYSTIPGVQEDVLNIILNLKQLRVKMFTDEPQVLSVNVKKAGVVTANDLEVPSAVEILNKDLALATLVDSKSPFVMEITVEKGIGYVNLEDKRQEVGFIPVDANFSPVERVNFEVTSARVGQITDLDKLTLDIYTKAIHPTTALSQALELYVSLLTVVKDQVQPDSSDAPREEAEEAPKKKAKKTTTKKK